MASALKTGPVKVGRLIVWLALSGSLLAYIRWGTELTAVTSFYSIRRSVPSIWGFFHDGLPEVGNGRVLELVFWSSLVALIGGVLALFWLALEPEGDVPPPDQDNA